MALISCNTTHRSSKEKIVFVSILPEKYFADKIAGGLYKVEVMVPPGVGPETYSPTPKQMKKLGVSDAYFAIGYLGFESDLMPKLSSLNPEMKLFNISKGINLIEEKEEKHEDHVHLHGVDPHVWSSPKEAQTIAKNICDGMIQIDPKNKENYLKNLQDLAAEINKVDSTVTAILAPVRGEKFVIFHPALGYFARDYGLEQYSIEFEGKIPSPKHMQELIDEARKGKITSVLIQKEFEKRNAEIVAQELGARLIQIDPLDYNWPKQMISIASSMASSPQSH
jgi:zinc transport system substrate-binding protein